MVTDWAALASGLRAALPRATLVCAALCLVGCPQILGDDFKVIPKLDELSAAGPGGAASGMGGGSGEDSRGASGGSSAALGTGDRDGGLAADDADPTTLNRFDAAAVDCRFATPEPITGLALATGSQEWGPALSADGLTLFLAATTGGDEDLYQARRADRGSIFSAAVPLTSLNTSADEGTPFLSANGLTLYFYAIREDGPGGRDIYFARRSDLGGAFSDPELLAGVNTGSREHLPRLSADELTIIFSSTRPGAGSGDLWTAKRADPTLAFETPVPLTSLNTALSEESGSLTRNGLGLLFDSTRKGGVGDNDVWTATRPSLTAPFGSLVNVSQVNSVRDEFNAMLSFDERELFFASNRAPLSTYHLWHAVRACP